MSTTLREAFEQIETRLSPTQRSYFPAVLSKWEKLTPNPDVSEITADMTLAFSRAVKKEGFSAHTVRRHGSCVRTLLAMLEYQAPTLDGVTEKTSLREVFGRYASARFIRDTRSRAFINWMKLYLGRVPVVADLRLETIDATAEMFRARGNTKKAMDRFLQSAISLLRFLNDHGVASHAPPRQCRYTPRPRLNNPEADPLDWSRRGTCGGSRAQPRSGPLRAVSQPADDQRPLAALVDYYAWKKLRGCVPATTSKYRRAVALLAESLGREPQIRDLTDDNVEAVMWHAKEEGSAVLTCESHRTKLCALWTFAHNRGILRTGADVPRWSAPRRIPKAWTLEQMGLLFEACERQKGVIAGIPASLWLHALFSLLYDTAERISAVLATRWDNYTAETRILLIPAETRKGKTEDLQFLLHPDTAAILERIRKPEREQILPWDRWKGLLWKMYKRLLKSAGLPYTHRDMFHKIRRTVASYYTAAGHNATLLLGHSSPHVTRAYLDPEICGTVRPPCEVLARPAESKGARQAGK